MLYKKNMHGTSLQETEVYNFVRMLLPNKCILRNDRKVLNGRELDIYLPAYGVAIEFNGLYYHSDAMRPDPFYHLKKSVECERKKIRLIQIMSDEWENKKVICMDIIKKALGLCLTIDASKCEVETLSEKEGQIFFNIHHIEGNDKKIDTYLGLICNDEIVGAIGLKKDKKNWNILRFTYRKDIVVSGGLKKLINTFIQAHTGAIFAEVDRRLDSGNEFKIAGFTEIQPTNPNIMVTKDFKKRVPIEAMKRFDESTLAAKGYHKVYDCGYKRFILN